MPGFPWCPGLSALWGMLCPVVLAEIQEDLNFEFEFRLWQCHLYHLNCCPFSNTLEASRQRLQSPVQRSQRPELFVKGTGGGTGATGRAFVMVMTFFPQLFQDLGLGCWKEKMKKGLEFLALLWSPSEEAKSTPSTGSSLKVEYIHGIAAQNSGCQFKFWCRGAPLDFSVAPGKAESKERPFQQILQTWQLYKFPKRS